jgi:hypothetical protein
MKKQLPQRTLMRSLCLSDANVGFLSLLVLLLCCHVMPVRAAQAPSEVLRLMPKGAISLQWRKLETREAAGPVWLHLYCVPKGHAEELQSMLDIKRSGPVLREHITTGPSLQPSPFWLDVFRVQEKDVWRRLNSVKFTQSKDVQEIVVRWLDVKPRGGPVLALHFGYTHWHDWEVLTFPRGWQQKAYHQTFFWGGEGEIGVLQRFDDTDARGRLLITETEFGEGNTRKTYRYRWNGQNWQDATQKYFVIGYSSPSRKATATFAAKKGYGEVLFSSAYRRLRPGYYVWVAGRYRTQREADEQVAALRKNGVTAYVRRAI